MDNKDKYEKITEERDSIVKAILDSQSRKKIVVAGPGTGKTYLFKKILEGKHNSLTLSFVNSLVEDLSLELYGLSEVRTLHSFARSELSRIAGKNIRISPKLATVIKEDSEILLEKQYEYEKIFYELIDNKEAIDFYKKRRQYYGYYGYTDIIYAIIKSYERNPGKIPSYEQILVDEFQDFNLLEVTLIDLLAEKSPILLTGDDDQALYDFKSASTKFIRDRHGSTMPDYIPFNLPYCARSTRVVVDSINEFIRCAKESGFLSGRIDKPYRYFENKEKDKESENYPKISYVQIYDKRIPWFIDKMISEMAEKIKNKFSVLIISPYKKQSQFIVKALNNKGLQNIEFELKGDPKINLLDGLKLILEDKNDNLGWRIVAKCILLEEEFKTLLKTSTEVPDKKIAEFINVENKDKVNKMLKVIKKISKNQPLINNSLNDFIENIGFDINSILINSIKEEINSDNQKNGNPATRKIPIKATTIQSSKGLSGDLVFITHFDNQYYIKSKDITQITDQEICNFLVALSRARKKVYLISSVHELPKFLEWIPDRNIDYIRI